MATFSDAAKAAAIQGILTAMEAGATLPGILLALHGAGPTYVNLLFANSFPVPAFQQTGATQFSLITPQLITVNVAGGVLTGAQLVGRDNNIWITMTVGDPGAAECEITPANVALVVGQQYMCNSVVLEFV